MRTILTLSACLLVFASFTAKAQATKSVAATLEHAKISFAYSSSRTIYSCDGAEYETKKLLAKLGATNIKTRCTGGIPYQQNVWVDAKFDVVRESAPERSTMMAQVTDIAVNYRESCDFHKQLFDTVITQFQVYAKQVHENCWYSEGQFQAKVSTLK